MSTYGERLEQLRRGHGAADRADPDHGERWRTVRYLAALELLVDAVGVVDGGVVPADGRGSSTVAALLAGVPGLEELGEEERRVLRWAAETLDAPTVAALAALLDRARTGAAVDA